MCFLFAYDFHTEMLWSYSLQTDHWLAKNGQDGRSLAGHWWVGRLLHEVVGGWQGQRSFFEIPQNHLQQNTSIVVITKSMEVIPMSSEVIMRLEWIAQVIVWLVDVEQASQQPCADLILTNFLFPSHRVIEKLLRLNSINTKLVGSQHWPTTKNAPTQYEISSWSF